MLNVRIIAVCGLIALLGTCTGYALHAQVHPSHEKHPEIRAAMQSLSAAADSLKRAATDFGGHRYKALEMTNNALKECRTALTFDK